jgi:biotin transport system substrate-specific component
MTIVVPRMNRLPVEQRGVTLADFLVPIQVGERVSARARNVALVVIGALFIYLTARIVFPVPGSPVPVTGQTFGVLLVGGALGFKRGLAAVALYVAIGLIGLPFFAEGRGGVSVIFGATGGYIIGFVLAGAIAGRLAEMGWDRNIGGAFAAMAIGNVVIYLVGVPWLMAVTGVDLPTAIALGVTPFVIGDLLKLALAAGTFRAGWWLIGRRPEER